MCGLASHWQHVKGRTIARMSDAIVRSQGEVGRWLLDGHAAGPTAINEISRVRRANRDGNQRSYCVSNVHEKPLPTRKARWKTLAICVVGLIYGPIRKSRALIKSSIKTISSGVGSNAISLPCQKLNRSGQRCFDPGTWSTSHILTGQQRSRICPDGNLGSKIVAHMGHQKIGVWREGKAHGGGTVAAGIVVANIAEHCITSEATRTAPTKQHCITEVSYRVAEKILCGDRHAERGSIGLRG